MFAGFYVDVPLVCCESEITAIFLDRDQGKVQKRKGHSGLGKLRTFRHGLAPKIS